MYFRSRKRIFPAVYIAFSIKNIILKSLQIQLIISASFSGLMVIENCTLVDSQTIEDFRRHLISSQILVFLFHLKITPHHIFCLEQISVLHILHFQIHGWKMIAIHYQYHTLIIFCQTIRQFFDKLIHLVKLIHIILPGIIFLLRFSSTHLNHRICQYRLFRVIPMSLNRNRIHIIRTLRGLHRLHNLICQNMVFHPSHLGSVADIRHVLLRSKGIKSQSGKYRPSSIKICLIIMNRMGSIPQFFQNISSTFTGFLFQNGFVRILSRSKISKTHSCNRFKFRIGSSCSYRRYFIVSG